MQSDGKAYQCVYCQAKQRDLPTLKDHESHCAAKPIKQAEWRRAAEQARADAQSLGWSEL